MENQKVKTILKSVVIIAILFVLVFGLRAQAADIGGVPNEIKANYMDADGLPYFSEMDSYFNLRMTQDYMDHGYFGDTLVNGSGFSLKIVCQIPSANTSSSSSEVRNHSVLLMTLVSFSLNDNAIAACLAFV